MRLADLFGVVFSLPEGRTNIIDIVFYIWSAGLIVGSLIPLMPEQTYWLRAWTYARLQMLALLTITALILILGYGLQNSWHLALLVAFILCAILCLRDILPFTSLGQKQVPTLNPDQGHMPLRLLVGNVLMENDRFDAMLDKIETHDPDIVFLVETDQKWADGLAVLKSRFPHTYLLPLEDFNGMLFYSKFPILKVDERYLVQDHIPSLTIDLDIGQGEPLRFYGVHPRPPRPEDDTADLDKELILIAEEAGQHASPILVTGDLNDVGWSSTTKAFLRISGLLDPRRGRGLYNSYNAKNPLVRWPLDHLFISDHFALQNVRRLDASGSDHFPLVIELGLMTDA
ncbi:hypothetical protein GCM10011309_27140 [Litorimonas cladophorae]|uniref:Endonuclease/exonuclease/phosphatase domain-containing protein n=1 Tax=Litorimonas cladophorae TaxID=1220491 RepID=A0A918KSK4_9PROT|nr:hypothetical protein GCM10011309_27140 [Litorimonas cladophorae]